MAEFTEVIKQRKRMCKAFVWCNECPLGTSEENCRELVNKKPKEAEEIIMKWAAEHPAMTNAEKFREVFGTKVITERGCDGIRCPGAGDEYIPCEICPYYGFWEKEYKEPVKGAEE